MQSKENLLLYDFQTYFDSDTVNYIGMKTIGDFSWDRRYFAFKVHCNGLDGTVDAKKASYIVLWDKTTGKVIKSRAVSNYNNTYYKVADNNCSFITMSPSGKYIIFETMAGGNYHCDVLDHNLNRIVQVKDTGIDLGHSAWGLDTEGNDVIISMGWSGVFNDNIIYTKLSDGTHYKIFDPAGDCDSCTGPDYYSRSGQGFYFATIPSFDSNLRGFVVILQYCQCTDDNGDQKEHCWGDKEMMIAQVIEEPNVWRVGHNQNCSGKYWYYGRMCFDQNGQYLYFDSNWRTNDDKTMDIYRFELPDNWWNEIKQTRPATPTGLKIIP